MTDKHTPGPWVLESYTSGGETRYFVRTRGAVRDDDGPTLDFAVAGGVREADAPLIAAAPEMYQALELAAKYVHPNAILPFDPGEPVVYATGVIQAALAKARGE